MIFIYKMDTDTTMFWSFCLISLFIGKVVSDYLFPNPKVFLEAYGGCDCGREECKKIDVIHSHGKMYRRIIQDSSKMTYKYSKIYNATQAAWAHNVAGGDDHQQVWKDNEWEENDAIVGFWSDGETDFHNVIFCRPGYAIYVQTEDEKEKANFQYGDIDLRIPPVILVNLNDAYDGEFLHSRVHPSYMDEDSDDEDSDDEDSDDEDSDDESECNCDDDERVHTRVPENQRVIDFLYMCRDATDNQYKKDAYSNAINEIHSYWSPIYPPTWKPCTIGESIERKIREFLDGVCEEDIINS
jgi:hypothetical protein